MKADDPRRLEPMEVSHSVREAASWRLATELCRRHPDRLRIYELHPGGGTYDCLAVSTAGSRPRPLIYLNRVGSIQVHETLAGSAPTDVPRWGWFDYLAADPYRFLREIEDHAGLTPPDTTPSTQTHTLVYRLLAATTTAQFLGVRHRYILSGYADSSGYDAGARDDLFEALPAADRRRRTCQEDDPFAVPEYRFWFVIDRGHVTACLDTTGWACHANGDQFDLPVVYEQSGRRLALALATAFPDLSS